MQPLGEVGVGVREGLLALLQDGPAHGYLLRSDLEAAVGGLWTVNVGQVYSTLQRLERDDLVAAAGEPDQDGRVPYSLTADGRDDVTEWLQRPEPLRDDVRDELVLRVLLARRSGLIDPQVVIDTQRAATMQVLQDFTRRRAALPAEDLERRLSLDRLALRARSELDWLDLVEERLDVAPDPPARDSDTPPPTDDPVPASIASEPA